MYVNQASDIAYDYIVERIRCGLWKSGDRIATESQLCDLIGVSKAAVRQAIERLVTISVLNKVQGSGTYVEKKENMSIMSSIIFGLDDELRLKILEFRKMFDSYNIELFIRSATATEIAQLQDNYTKMIMSKDDSQEFHKLDQFFHAIIANGTRNPMIMQISKLFVDIFVDNQKLNDDHVGSESVIKYHGKILQAINEKNAEVASIYARMSIEESIRRINMHNHYCQKNQSIKLDH